MFLVAKELTKKLKINDVIRTVFNTNEDVGKLFIIFICI